MNDPFAAIKRRHPNIPQDPLPIPEAEPRGRGERQRSKPSIRQAKCPHCHKTELTGVIRLADGTEVFRNHNKVLALGARIRCSGSGKQAP